MTDRLLEWLSYRGSGRANDLPADLRPESRPYRAIADLAILGHIEQQQDDRWQVAPPVLAALGDGSEEIATAVLCGARTSGLTEKLASACAAHGGVLTRIPQHKRPDCIRVTAATTSDLCAIAAAAALNWQRDAGFTLLASLPTISSWPRSSCQMVSGKVKGVPQVFQVQVAVGFFDFGGNPLGGPRAIPDQAGLRQHRPAQGRGGLSVGDRSGGRPSSRRERREGASHRSQIAVPAAAVDTDSTRARLARADALFGAAAGSVS